MILRIGDTIISLIDDQYTVTTINGAPAVIADHTPQEGQHETAERYGYGTDVRRMNREHDLTHSLVSYWLGLPFSPTLHAVAYAMPATDAHRIEEDAVLAVQRLAQAHKIDLVGVARRIAKGK